MYQIWDHSTRHQPAAVSWRFNRFLQRFAEGSPIAFPRHAETDCELSPTESNHILDSQWLLTCELTSYIITVPCLWSPLVMMLPSDYESIRRDM